MRGKYAEAYQALLEIGSEISTTRGKGYSLTKLPSKKAGYVYYARYSEGGVEIPTKFTTHTNDREAAEPRPHD
ncbi:MAG: hypothetical protein Pg6C_03650 [Treponemataceae bacterium]|nr:MAG: hypothetical protein Pg6C_03650 [Treponemataceae bacterium]